MLTPAFKRRENKQTLPKHGKMSEREVKLAGVEITGHFSFKRYLRNTIIVTNLTQKYFTGTSENAIMK